MAETSAEWLDRELAWFRMIHDGIHLQVPRNDLGVDRFEILKDDEDENFVLERAQSGARRS